ncbi:MAG TPA: molybdopterin converting factor subunit 1 [Burkholderiaceae bacterium]|nr:molybdopterin converting factor subunit 1 [Burkholderiaceae bacterium]
MKLRLRYFAALREAVGISEETLIVPAAVCTAGALRTYLQARGGVWADALGPTRPIRIAINQRMAQPSDALEADAEVAFFPPVTGG